MEQKPTQNKPQQYSQVPVQQNLPPLETLIKEAWTTLKKSALNLLILYVLTIVVGVLVLILLLGLGWVIASATGAIKAISSILPLFSGGGDPTQIVQHLSTIGVSLAITFAIIIPVSILIQTAISITQIRLIGHAHEGTSVSKELRAASKKIFPYILLNIILFLIEIGGFFLFIIPGIVFALLLSPAIIELALYEVGVKKAIKNAYRVITQNFIEALVRGLLLIVIFIGVYMTFFILKITLGALGNLASQDLGNVLKGLVQLIQGLSGMFISWYASCYGITLYKQLREITNFEKKAKIRWVVIVATFGWVLALGGGFLGFRALTKGIRSGTFGKMLQPKNQQDIDWNPAPTPPGPF